MAIVPDYIWYLIGVGYLFLILVIFYLCIARSRVGHRKSYSQFKDEENIIPTTSNQSESYNVIENSRINPEYYPKLNYHNITENEFIPRSSTKRGIDMISVEHAENHTLNQGPTVFIPPNIMEKICEAVLKKKITTITESNSDDGLIKESGEDDGIVTESGAEDRKSNSESDNELSMNMIRYSSSDYDIVKTPKSVELRISSYNPEVSSKQIPARESYYKCPITFKMAYVNAN